MPILGVVSSSIAKPAGSFEPIASVTLGGNNGTTISNIPSGYKHLQLRFGFTAQGAGFTVTIRLNGSSSSYFYSKLAANNAGWEGTGNPGSNGFLFYTMQGTVGTSYQNLIVADIYDYSSTSISKTVRGIAANKAGSGNGQIEILSGNWLNTSAVNSVSMTTGTNLTGVFALYGIKE